MVDAWAKSNPAKANAASKKWKDANKGRVKEYHHKRYASDPERFKRESRERAKKLRAEDPNYYKAGNVRKYGITLEEVFAMRDDQGNRCAICGVPFVDIAYHIDHDHATGKVRGLLCQGCNLMLGWIERSPLKLDVLFEKVGLFLNKRPEEN
jgi:hypothetical protein